MAQTLRDIVNELLNLPPNKTVVIRRGRKGLYNLDTKTREKEEERDLPYVESKVVDSSLEYGILFVPRESRRFFPGYREQFVLETDIKPFVMHLTAADDGTRVGENEGGYLCHPRPTEVETRFLRQVPDANTREGTFLNYFRAHPEIRYGDSLKIHRVSRELYSLSR